MADLSGALREWAERNDTPEKLIGGGPFLHLVGDAKFTIVTNRYTLICVRGDICGVDAPVEPNIREYLDRMISARPVEIRETGGSALRAFLGDPAWGLPGLEPAASGGYLVGVPLTRRLLAQPLSLLPQPNSYRVAAHAIRTVPVVYVYGDGWFVLQAGCDVRADAAGVWEQVPVFQPETAAVTP